MPGFGDNAFGNHSFGEWDWSYYVFWKLIPEDIRLAAEEYGYLHLYIDGIRKVFDKLRTQISDLHTLRDPLTARTQYNETTALRLGRRINSAGPVTQQGIDGHAPVLGIFESRTAHFDENSIGQTLTVSRSTVPENNEVFTVVSQLSIHRVVTEPLILTDPGALHWEIRDAEPIARNRRTYQVISGDISAVLPKWTFFDGYAEHTVLNKRHFRHNENFAYIDHSGNDGTLVANNNFVTGQAIFLPTDVGRHLTLRGFASSEYDGNYEITRVVHTTHVTICAADGMSAIALPPTNDLAWALRPFPEIDIISPNPPRGIVEQSGVDLTVSGDIAQAPSARFSEDDVGKILYVHNSDSAGPYRVLEFLTPGSIRLETPGALPHESDLLWRLHTPTGLFDLTYSTVHAPSLLQYLAEDFGITIDTQFTEYRQRSWVRNVSRWTPRKGTTYAYEIICAICGFLGEVSQLYRINVNIANIVPAGSLIDIGDTAPGKSGSHGSLYLTSEGIRFSDPGAQFTHTDRMRAIRIRNAAVTSNNKYLTIDQIINSTTIQIALDETAVVPDPANGELLWSVARLYTTLPPKLPRYDHANPDLLEAIVSSSGTHHFRIDKYCWESDWSSDVPITVIDVVSETSTIHTLRITHNTGSTATGSIGFNQSLILLSAITPGAHGNAISITVIDPTPTILRPLVVSVSGNSITVRLSTDILGNLNPPANTAPLVAAAINGAAGHLVTATSMGTEPLTHAEAQKFLTGGSDEFLNAPEAVLGATNWKCIIGDATYWLESPPVLAAPGPPPEYTITVFSPTVPSTGDSILRYACELIPHCTYCPASTLQIVASYDTLFDDPSASLERAWDRMKDRLREATPAHVRLVLTYKQTLEASFALSAEIVPGITNFASLYAPFTVYDEEIHVDSYPADTILTAEVVVPAPIAILRGRATLTTTARVA